MPSASVHPRAPTCWPALWLCLAAAAGSSGAVAQATIYESRGKDGPVFSDQPSPGATPVTVGPTNVVQSPKAPAKPAPAADAAPPASYRSLAIAAPQDRGTVHTNTGAFDVSLRISPGLRSGSGDRVVLVLDGATLPKTYRSTSIRVTENDWRSADAAGSMHTLQALVVDSAGRVLVESSPVLFYAQRTVVGSGRRR
jgi:hypothetical protein